MADGVPLRVLIVPKEAGGSGKYASIAQRRTEPLKPCQERNQHMKGVTFALQLAFGLPVTCSGPEGETLVWYGGHVVMGQQPGQP